MKHSVKTALCYVFAVAFVLAGWEITALALNTPALPGPIETVSVFARYAATLWPDFLTSLGRLVVSLALGCVLGVPVGLFLGRSQKVGALFSPVLYLLYPLPKIVLLPILLVLFGLGGAPKIALVTITVFFQVVMVMRDAAAAIPAATLLSVRSLGASRAQVWRYVVLRSGHCRALLLRVHRRLHRPRLLHHELLGHGELPPDVCRHHRAGGLGLRSVYPL